MSLLRRLLLLPLLAPLLAVMVVGAVNPRPAVRLRLLIWTSPPLPVGVWLLLASAGGALLSGGATALALRSGAPSLQRQVFRDVWDEPEPRRSPAPAAAPQAAPRPAPAPPPGWSDAGPSREPGEPAPTVAVAYRVIRRPDRSGVHAGGATTTPTATATTTATAPATESSDLDQGWGELPGEDW